MGTPRAGPIGTLRQARDTRTPGDQRLHVEVDVGAACTDLSARAGARQCDLSQILTGTSAPANSRATSQRPNTQMVGGWK